MANRQKKKINKKNRIALFLVGIIFVSVLMLNFVSAHGNFNETKKLIDSGISCQDLSDEQLEEMGDYYMEQMHPGESHEMMHQMMGGEDSELTKEMHINMAKSIYCGETNSGMMGMMGSGGMMTGGMMGGGMMSGNMMTGNVMGSGMMYGYNWNIYNLLFLILLISLIILVIVIIIKLLRNMRKK